MQAISQGGSEHVINADACIVRAGRTQENSMPDQTQAMMSQRGRLRARYDNFIGGKWQTPAKGRYFVDSSPIDGMKLCDVARSDVEDVERALDAAHAAKDAWGRTAPAERARMLNKIADRIEENLALLAYAETVDNGKPIRETTNADVPLAADHFRYFAGCIRAEEGTLAELDNDTVAYHFHEPMGVVGQIIPWNFPLLMAAWKMAPALATGNCVVIKPASDTPLSLAVLMDLVGDILPPGVLNVVNGHGSEVGAPLASSPRIAKISFTGETTTGRQIMQYAAENLIPSTMELGGKSPNIFMADVMDADDAFFDKALEGFALFAFNKGEVCTCPSRALIQESIFEKFIEKAVARVAKIRMGNPLDPTTMMGAQASHGQLEKILAYVDVGKQEGAKLMTGGERAHLGGELENGYYMRPTVFVGPTRCASSRRKSSGRCCRSRRSGPWRRRSPSATTPSMALAPAYGRATARWRIASDARYRPVACGPTASTCIRRMRRSAATSTRATAARPTG
jgi:aldehyde dehydrogenase